MFFFSTAFHELSPTALQVDPVFYPAVFQMLSLFLAQTHSVALQSSFPLSVQSVFLLCVCLALDNLFRLR